MFSQSTAKLAGRIGGFVRASRVPREQLTAAARAGFLARFEREVDPEHQLSTEERRRRAEAARRAYMARLALLSAQSRRKSQARKERATVATVAEEVRDAATRSSL